MKANLEKITAFFKGLDTSGKIVLAMLLAFSLGYCVKWVFTGPGTQRAVSKEHEQKQQVWTCSMHPQIKLPKKGLCPICNMELIPLEEGDSQDDGDSPRLTVSENAKKLMDIETAEVERKFVTATVRVVGKVEYDETNLAYITAWVPGRLDRLYVDYTGIPVTKGDHMVYLYSPQLLSAQEELIQAVQSLNNAKPDSLMHDMSESTLTAVREKLRLWGLAPEQIENIEKTGSVSDHITIYAPTSGIVIHKNAIEGMYVQTGTKIYTIADLSGVWVKLDAYESDLQWLRYGQEVEFTTVSFPGETFKGTISFIDPILNDRTRTVKIRVNVPNPQGKLKPNMFVKAAVHAQIAGTGQIMDADMAGKWICPMHPEIIKDESGICDICEMPLVTTESLGYVSDDPQLLEMPLVIPASAPLITGTRAVVYVQLPNTEKPTFEGRQITLGPRASDYYIVKDGLKEGEYVVVKGNFKIDSSLQIQAKPSMMSPQGGPASTGHEHHLGTQTRASRTKINGSFRKQLNNIFKSYFVIQQALADDNTQKAVDSAKKMIKKIKVVDMKLLTGNDHNIWMKSSKELNKITGKITKAKDINLLRENFYPLSQSLAKLAKHFGSSGEKPVYILKCPMAFNNTGAEWLQSDDQTRNPYFGHAMLKCGSVIETIPSADIWEKE